MKYFLLDFTVLLLAVTTLDTMCHAFSSSKKTCNRLKSALSKRIGMVKEDGISGVKNVFEKASAGKILILGGSGFLGETIARRAVLEGYSVTSLSRREKPVEKEADTSTDKIDFRVGDACEIEAIERILEEGGYTAVIHCIGVLFDSESGIGNLNRFVSGSGSVPDKSSTYDDITKKTAFNAISAAEAYAQKLGGEPLPFIFSSAAEAGWPDVRGGSSVERFLAPKWLKRYLEAKRSVEIRLQEDQTLLRPVIFRPSLIFSLDRLLSLPPVGAFYVGSKLGLPFVDRPVTVQSLSTAIVRSIGNPKVRGVFRFKDIDELSR